MEYFIIAVIQLLGVVFAALGLHFPPGLLR